MQYGSILNTNIPKGYDYLNTNIPKGYDTLKKGELNILLMDEVFGPRRPYEYK